MQKIREYRLKNGMTAKQLAAMLHLSESSVTMYETGKREPTPDTLSRIADILDTTVDELLGRQEKKPVATHHELSETEQEIIRLLDQIPEEKRTQVLAYIEASLRLQGVL